VSPSAPIDPAWHQEQVARYVQEQARYAAYARTLETILNKACSIHAPLGIVQSRPKSVASFAEKAARKAHKYKDPVNQITDLCGARVIVNTQDHMNAICRFIRDQFVIDEANSLDAGSRLNEAEFGYQSVHFIVQIKRPEILGVTVPLDQIGDRKAEIQVRTVLQHAWAATTHDRLYKSGFTVPVRLRRLAHRIAALLEDGDAAFNAFEREMQAYLGSYSAYMKPDELAYEMAIQDLVLAVEPKAENKPGLALRLARLARAAGRVDRAIEVLTPYQGDRGPNRLPILVELGTALIEQCRHDQASAGFKDGQALLREALGKVPECTLGDESGSPSDRKLRAAAAVTLAENSPPIEARACYTDALQLDPDDPYILCSQLANTLNHTGERAVIDSAAPAILRALEVCRAHVAAGLELPHAWFTMGRLYLLLRQDAAALDQYAKAIRFYLADPQQAWSRESLGAECDFLVQIQGRGDTRQPEIKWTEQFLRMSFWLKNGRPGEVGAAAGRNPSGTRFDPAQRVLLVAGGTQAELLPQLESYRSLLKAAIDRCGGMVLSGGTSDGIPGMLGQGAGELARAGRKTCRLAGYHPYYLPAGITLSRAYDVLIPGDKEEAFGLGEPLQMWLDLLASGVDPAQVRLLGINGGRISRFEYALALAFGALVGLVQSSGRSADLMLSDPDWARLPTLLPLPNDPMTAQAFAQMGSAGLSEEELERMGRLVHENYRQGMKPNLKKPNTLPWELLPEDFRTSSREQAAYAITMLRKSGYRVEKVAAAKAGASIRDGDVECLAEVEHGRWNFERLRSGWRFGSQKDDDRRISPYLVPWTQLPDSVREWDRKAVRLFPAILAAGGYEVRPPA
jgi:ppGpp synthetase/RelA/SpoT-type nucleotidyltranferase